MKEKGAVIFLPELEMSLDSLRLHLSNLYNLKIEQMEHKMQTGGTADSAMSNDPTIGGTMASSMQRGGMIMNIGDLVHITEEKSLMKGKSGYIVMRIGKDYIVKVLDNGNERSVLVRSQGLEKVNEMKRGGNTEDIYSYDTQDSDEEDLFENWEKLPPSVMKILDKYTDAEGYTDLDAMLSEMNEEGYTFEYGLDAVPYGLKKMAKGGGVNERIISSDDFVKNTHNWVHLEYTEKQVQSVLNSLRESDITVNDLKVYSDTPERQSKKVYSKVDELFEELMPGNWDSRLEDKDVKNILWASIMEASNNKYSEGGGINERFVSVANSKSGQVFSKTGSFKYALLDKLGRNLNKWSNNKSALEKEIDFLSKGSWEKDDLEIVETEIKNYYANGGGVKDYSKTIQEYKDLIEADMEKLKTATGSKADSIKESLVKNKKALRMLEMLAKKKMAKGGEVENVKRGDKIIVYGKIEGVITNVLKTKYGTMSYKWKSTEHPKNDQFRLYEFDYGKKWELAKTEMKTGGGVKATKKQAKKVGKVMHEWKAGKLHSGSKKGPIVKEQKQAIAIALSEAGLSKKETGGKMSGWKHNKSKKAVKRKTINLPAPTEMEVRYKNSGMNDLITRKVDWSKEPISSKLTRK